MRASEEIMRIAPVRPVPAIQNANDYPFYAIMVAVIVVYRGVGYQLVAHEARYGSFI